MPTMSELAGGIMPAIRGVGTGALMGLEKYPSAGIMQLIDKLMGEGNLSFKEALDVINQQQQGDRADHPIASYGGEVAGTLIPGSAALKMGGLVGRGLTTATGSMVPTIAASPVGQMAARGATALGDTTLLGATAQGAAQGGVRSFNENQNLGEAGTGAGLGAILGGGGAAVTALGARGLRSVMGNVAQERAAQAAANALKYAEQKVELENNIKILKSAGLDASDLVGQLKTVKKKMDAYSQSAKVGSSISKQMDNKAISTEDLIDPIASGLLKNAKTNVFGKRAQENNIGSSLLTAGLLGGGGYVAGNMLGLDPAIAAGLAGGGSGLAMLRKPIIEIGAGVAAKGIRAPRAVGALAAQNVGPVAPLVTPNQWKLSEPVPYVPVTSGEWNPDTSFAAYPPAQDAQSPQEWNADSAFAKYVQPQAEASSSAAPAPAPEWNADDAFAKYVKKK